MQMYSRHDPTCILPLFEDGLFESKKESPADQWKLLEDYSSSELMLLKPFPLQRGCRRRDASDEAINRSACLSTALV